MNESSIVPTNEEKQMAARAADRLRTRKSRSESVELTIAVAGRHEQFPLPATVVQLLSGILDETASGHAVTIVPVDPVMTTSEAANYLNVSRPFLVGLLENGEIPFHRVGSHRRVRLDDLSVYKQHRRQESYRLMAELQSQAEDLGIEELRYCLADRS